MTLRQTLAKIRVAENRGIGGASPWLYVPYTDPKCYRDCIASGQPPSFCGGRCLENENRLLWGALTLLLRRSGYIAGPPHYSNATTWPPNPHNPQDSPEYALVAEGEIARSAVRKAQRAHYQRLQTPIRPTIQRKKILRRM